MAVTLDGYGVVCDGSGGKTGDTFIAAFDPVPAAVNTCVDCCDPPYPAIAMDDELADGLAE